MTIHGNNPSVYMYAMYTHAIYIYHAYIYAHVIYIYHAYIYTSHIYIYHSYTYTMHMNTIYIRTSPNDPDKQLSHEWS